MHDAQRTCTSGTKNFGKRQLYTGNTQKNVGATWNTWNSNTDWQLLFTSWRSAIKLSSSAVATSGSGSYVAQMSFGIDQLSSPSPAALQGVGVYPGFMNVIATIRTTVEMGNHTIQPIAIDTSPGGSTMFFYYYGANLSALRGTIMC